VSLKIRGKITFGQIASAVKSSSCVAPCAAPLTVIAPALSVCIKAG